MKKTIILSIALALVLTACGTTNSSDQPPNLEDLGSKIREDEIPRVNQQDFDKALQNVKFIVDEFDGTWEIFSSPETEEVSRKATGPRNTRYAISIGLYILRETSDSPLDARASINFLGTECMNIYQWDTKSKAGVVNFDFESDLSECGSEAGYPGVITESANRYMSEAEMLNYCEIVNGTEVTFRITGFDGILSLKGGMPKTAIGAHKNICVVYKGLLDGLIPKTV